MRAVLAVAYAGFLAAVAVALAYEAVSRAVLALFRRGPRQKKRPRVVVVGGGFAGASAAYALQDEADVTMVDAKPYFEYTPSVPRALVDEAAARRIQVPHAAYLGRAATVLHARAAALDADGRRVLLEGGGGVAFDYAVLATGTDYEAPFKDDGRVVLAHRLDGLAEASARVRAAGSVMVVGGGPTGVEAAAEIAGAYPDKRVTVVHSGPRLLHRCPEGASAYARAHLEALGVRVLAGDRVDLAAAREAPGDARAYTTRGGSEVVCHVALLCTGVRPNSALLRASGGAAQAALDARGYARVGRFLQLEGCGGGRVFVAGDLTSAREEKLAQAAERRADLVARNVAALAAGRDMAPYQAPSRLPVVISLGPADGVVTFGDAFFGGAAAAVLKEVVEWRGLARYLYGVRDPYLLPGVGWLFKRVVMM